jgi:hypothetical protein
MLDLLGVLVAVQQEMPPLVQVQQGKVMQVV